jgi:hypothetical protein
VREMEAELAHFRERATRAEAWLLRIHSEAEQVFFQKGERELRQAPIAQVAIATSAPGALIQRSIDAPGIRNPRR